MTVILVWNERENIKWFTGWLTKNENPA